MFARQNPKPGNTAFDDRSKVNDCSEKAQVARPVSVRFRQALSRGLPQRRTLGAGRLLRNVVLP